MPQMMKALVKRKPEQGIWMEEVPLPQVGPNEVLMPDRLIPFPPLCKGGGTASSATVPVHLAQQEPMDRKRPNGMVNPK